MRHGNRIAVIIPALDEAASIEEVIRAIPEWVDQIVVADNGSTDGTDRVARAAGAEVIVAPRRGYGSACLTGMSVISEAQVIVFLDGDLADDPAVMADLVDPILSSEVDLVIGSRVLGQAEPGSLTAPQRYGNWLACTLIHLIWGRRFTDLGPFRAVGAEALARLRMSDPDYGWTVEMQVKAVRHGLRCAEVPVPCRRRVGRSKISGTVRGTMLAGQKILYVIAAHAIGMR